jgi:hypothetical protein
MENQILKIEATTGEAALTQGTALVHLFSPQEKLARALKKLAVFWGVAVLSVFIPVAHFFLVPLFLVIGLVLFFNVMKTTGEVLEGKICCPSCGAEAVLGRDFLNWPLKEICQNCVRVLRIRSLEEPRPPTSH